MAELASPASTRSDNVAALTVPFATLFLLRNALSSPREVTTSATGHGSSLATAASDLGPSSMSDAAYDRTASVVRSSSFLSASRASGSLPSMMRARRFESCLGDHINTRRSAA